MPQQIQQILPAWKRDGLGLTPWKLPLTSIVPRKCTPIPGPHSTPDPFSDEAFPGKTDDDEPPPPPPLIYCRERFGDSLPYTISGCVACTGSYGGPTEPDTINFDLDGVNGSGNAAWNDLFNGWLADLGGVNVSGNFGEGYWFAGLFIQCSGGIFHVFIGFGIDPERPTPIQPMLAPDYDFVANVNIAQDETSAGASNANTNDCISGGDLSVQAIHEGSISLG